MHAPASYSALAARALDEVTARFAIVPTELLRSRRLMRRTDTKFILSARDLPDLLADFIGHYRVHEVSHRRLLRYETFYFDEPDLRCFRDHHSDARPRHKVRIRRYADRRVSYFEIKEKQPDGLTNKHRKRHGYDDLELDGDARRMVRTHTSLAADRLSRTMAVTYRRMTLVAEHREERATIDIDVEYRGHEGHGDFGDCAILEVKQASFDRESPIMRALRSRGARRSSISKYCAALASVLPATTLP